jgi:hypothetical protein
MRHKLGCVRKSAGTVCPGCGAEEPSWYEEGRARWEARGYEVQDHLCPECDYGYLVRPDNMVEDPAGRWWCTNYGGCEAAPG